MKNRGFILDECNKAAYALAEGIGEASVPPIYNPAIIYGSSGNGKTHLMKLIEERALEKGKNIMIISGEQLLAKLIYSIKNTQNFSVAEFCRQFYEMDVLIVEDIQYIKDKHTTQECLIEITKHFVENEKQLVFTVNALEELDLFYPQLKAQFAFSVQVKIEESTEKLRTKILEAFCKEKGWIFSEIMKQSVAAATRTPAELLGVMKHIMFYCDEMKETLNQELIEKVLKERKSFLK